MWNYRLLFFKMTGTPMGYLTCVSSGIQYSVVLFCLGGAGGRGRGKYDFCHSLRPRLVPPGESKRQRCLSQIAAGNQVYWQGRGRWCFTVSCDTSFTNEESKNIPPSATFTISHIINILTVKQST